MTQDEFIDAVIEIVKDDAKTADTAEAKAIVVRVLGQERADALFALNLMEFLQMFTFGGLVRLAIETK